LSLGLKFIPIPKPNKNYQSTILTQFNDFARRVRIKKHFAMQPTSSETQSDIYLPIKYKQNTWEPNNTNGIIENYLKHVKQKLLATFNTSLAFKYSRNPNWLHKATQELVTMSRDDLIVKPADKNMGVVIQDRLQYERDCLKQLHDINTYTPVITSSIDYDTIFKQLAAILDKYHKLYISYNKINTKQYNKTTQYTKLAKQILQMQHFTDKVKLARFYLLYKVHKTPVVGRPICSNIDTVTYYASKYVDRKLQPYMKLTKSYTQSSQSIVTLLETFKIDKSYKKDMVIMCADVTSLYPNIPIETGIAFMRLRLLHLHEQEKKITNKTPLLSESDIEFVCELSEFILNNNYIEFGDHTYKQIRGTAMGTPLAVVFANLFLQHLEHIVLSKLKHEFPVLYKRYIDDLFALFKCKADALTYINIFNSIVDTIKITYTLSTLSGIFLDLIVLRGPRYDTHSLLDVQLYQKPQNMFQYLLPTSFHNDKIFPAWINSELNRIRLNCSIDTDYETNKQLFYTRLLKRQYSPEFLQPLFDVIRCRSKLLNNIAIKNKTSITKSHKSTSVIFKTVYCQESKQFNKKLKQCLQLTNEVKQDLHFKQIFNGRNPIICYQKSNNLGQLLSKTQYKHEITCDHVLDYCEKATTPTTAVAQAAVAE
jgi:hypothetical protein